MCPISYFLILLAKFKYIFRKPRENSKDVLFRIGDFIIFIFIGIFLILFWIAIDTFRFSVNLFSKNIMLIDKSERRDQTKINEQMDGSLQNKEETNMDKLGMTGFKVMQQPAFRAKTNNKVLNPLKEGLSDTTFKILNA